MRTGAERQKLYRERHPDRAKENRRKYYYENGGKERKRAENFLKRYGITLEEYNELFEAQNGVCKICLKPETRTIKGQVVSLAVDHCHTTLAVRGLLCHKCNIAISYLADDPVLMERAANYVRSC